MPTDTKNLKEHKTEIPGIPELYLILVVYYRIKDDTGKNGI